MFTKAIVKTPCKNMTAGLTNAGLGPPCYEKALKQHEDYVNALRECALEVIILEADEAYPDSTFVEDTALLTPNCAIITNPGADSRRGETIAIEREIEKHYSIIERVTDPGRVDAGDIMMVGTCFYIGLSGRTNEAGARQMIDILNRHGMTASLIRVEEVLHLKTGVSYLENNNLLTQGTLAKHPDLVSYNILTVDDDESYAANSVYAGERVLIPLGYPKTKALIQKAGYSTIEVDVSEFQKLDGGLSCLSLRF